METTKTKRTREEVRAAFRETMRRKKERMEENKGIDEFLGLIPLLIGFTSLIIQIQQFLIPVYPLQR